MAPILQMKNPNKILNKLATKPMTKYELKQTLNIHYSRVSGSISRLEKDGYATRLQTLPSTKGTDMHLYSLTIKGAIAYLSSIIILDQNDSENNPTTEINQPNKTIHQPANISPLQKNEPIEAYKERMEKEQEKYQKDLERMADFLETSGKRLNYPLFSEIRWLREKYGDQTFKKIITVAKIINDQKPFPSSGMLLITHAQNLKKQIHASLEGAQQKNIKDLGDLIEDLKETEETLRILRLKENEWWSMAFAAGFAEEFCQDRGEGNMHNEALMGFFARVAEYYRRLEVEPAEKMTQTFSEHNF